VTRKQLKASAICSVETSRWASCLV